MSEPTPVKVTRYRCPSCGRTYSGRSGAREHMSRCWYAPENRGCKTCIHFDRGSHAEPEVGYPGTEEGVPQGRRPVRPPGVREVRGARRDVQHGWSFGVRRLRRRRCRGQARSDRPLRPVAGGAAMSESKARLHEENRRLRIERDEARKLLYRVAEEMQPSTTDPGVTLWPDVFGVQPDWWRTA